MAKKYEFKIESTVNKFNDYKIHKNLILYLLKTINSYHKNNLKKKI